MSKFRMIRTTGPKGFTDARKLVVLGATRGQVFVQSIENENKGINYCQKMLPCWILIMQDVMRASDFYFEPLVADGVISHPGADRLVYSQDKTLPMGEDTIRICSPISCWEFLKYFEEVRVFENQQDIKRRILCTAEELHSSVELIPSCNNILQLISDEEEHRKTDVLGGGSRRYVATVTEYGDPLLWRQEDQGICWRLTRKGEESVDLTHALLRRALPSHCIVNKDAGIMEYDHARFELSDWKVSIVPTLQYLAEYDQPNQVQVVADFDGWYTERRCNKNNSTEFLHCRLGLFEAVHYWEKEVIIVK